MNFQKTRRSTKGTANRLLLLVAMLVCTALETQAQTSVWEWHFGGAAAADEAWAVKTLSNGNTVSIGYTQSYGVPSMPGQPQICVRIADRLGFTLGVQQFGLISDMRHFDIVEMGNGDIAWVATYFNQANWSWDIVVGKMDFNMIPIWYRKIATAEDEIGASIIETADGHLAIAGYVENANKGTLWDPFAAKINSGTGATFWSRSYSEGTQAYNERGLCIRQVNLSDYIICGYADARLSPGQEEAFILRVGPTGTAVQGGFYGMANTNDIWRDIEDNGNNTIVVVGESCSTTSPTSDIMAAKINTNTLAVIGSLNCYNPTSGGPGENGAYAIERSHTPFHFVVTGYTEPSSGAGRELFLMELGNNLGTPLWFNFYGGTGTDFGHDVSIFENTHPDLPGVIERGYHVIGFTESQTGYPREWYALRTGVNGFTGCEHPIEDDPTLENRSYIRAFEDDHWAHSTAIEMELHSEHWTLPICQDTDGTVFIKQGIDSPVGPQNGITFGVTNPTELGTDAHLFVSAKAIESGQTLDYDIYDLQGRKVLSGVLQVRAGESQVELATSTLQAGVYTFRIRTAEYGGLQFIVAP